MQFPVHELKTPEQADLTFALHDYHPGDRAQRANFPHRHNFHQVIYLTEGQGQHIVDFYALPIRPPTLFFVSAGQVHFWQIHKHLRGQGLLFTPAFLQPGPGYGAEVDMLAMVNSLSYFPLQLELAQARLLQQIIELVVHEHDTHKNDVVLNSYLQILFVEIQRIGPTLEPGLDLAPTTERVRRYRELVSQYFRKHRSVQFYADQLGVSVAHLSRTIKDVTGHTASTLIRQELVMEAKRLLLNTDMVVERISEELAFSDPAYFGRFFKRETGYSPGAFRNATFEKHRITLQ